MTRKKGTSGVVSYYETLQQIFNLESRILTGVLPHSGERGRNDEERFRAFLTRVLPRRFSVGSGFVVCSDPNVPTSSQTDVVIFDEVYNSPLHRELAAFVYPVEMVYGTIEVKGTLNRSRLVKACRDIRKIRELGKHQYYVEYGTVLKDPKGKGQPVVGRFERQQKVPPRAFLFAFAKSGWRTIDDLASTLCDVTSEEKAHIHGLAVLDADWYLAQEAFTNPPQFRRVEGNALMHFIRGMLHSIASRAIGQVSIDRYLDPENSPAEPAKPSDGEGGSG